MYAYTFFLLISLCVDYIQIISISNHNSSFNLNNDSASSLSSTPFFTALEEQFVSGQISEQSNATEDEKLKINVYYETLCGDSKRFIRSQLYPLMIEQGGHKHFDVKLIPYGKASTRKTASGYQFTCQHREGECEGNKMHSCALKYIPSQEQQLQFITCSMKSSYPPTSLNECSTQLRLDSSIENLIKTCSDSIEGDELLAANGILTGQLSPKIFFVPTITFNQVFNEDKMWTSLGNLKTVACDEIKKTNIKADFCSRQSREYRGDRRARSFL